MIGSLSLGSGIWELLSADFEAGTLSANYASATFCGDWHLVPPRT